MLSKYSDLLKQANKTTNLTSSKENIDFHIDASVLWGSEITTFITGNILDIGSGGGFPAIPLLLTISGDYQYTLLDSVSKKVNHLNHFIAELEITNATAIHTRIEDHAATHRQSYDVVTAMAVAPLNTLLEYALPLLKVGGHLLAFKGLNLDTEIAEAKNALGILGGEVVNVFTKTLGDRTHNLCVIKKTKPTNPLYPRGGNKPRIKPL